MTTCNVSAELKNATMSKAQCDASWVLYSDTYTGWDKKM